jgi:hypothetical protein
VEIQAREDLPKHLVSNLSWLKQVVSADRLDGKAVQCGLYDVFENIVRMFPNAGSLFADWAYHKALFHRKTSDRGLFLVA